MKHCIGLDCVFVTKGFEKNDLAIKYTEGACLTCASLEAPSMFIAQWILNKHLLSERLEAPTLLEIISIRI